MGGFSVHFLLLALDSYHKFVLSGTFFFILTEGKYKTLMRYVIIIPAGHFIHACIMYHAHMFSLSEFTCKAEIHLKRFFYRALQFSNWNIERWHTSYRQCESRWNERMHRVNIRPLKWLLLTMFPLDNVPIELCESFILLRRPES